MKIKNIFDFSKTVAKMLFLSVSRESIGILTISRKQVFRSTPPSRRDRLILRSKMVENHENRLEIDDFIVFPKGITTIPFGKSHNWADPEILKDFDLKINLSPRLGGVERKTFF